MDGMMDRTLEAALAYAKRGWAVLPVYGVKEDGACACTGHGPCSPGKHPATGKGVYGATTDVERIRAWGARWRFSNLGIRTGSVSGLMVLDIDKKHGGEKTLDTLTGVHGPLPPTIECRTGGGGRHVYFRYPSFMVRNSSGKIGLGLDIRGEAGYVVAPPSRHSSGTFYQWTLAWEEEPEPAEAPGWLLQKLLAGQEGPLAKAHTIQEGQRNQTLFSMARTLKGVPMASALVEPALQAVNLRCCAPPLAQSEVHQICSSVSRHAPPKRQGRAKMPVITPLAQIHSEPLRWLWPGHIPSGKLTLLAGDPGLGKSLLSLDVAARVSSGKPWPGENDGAPLGGVILLVAEDDLGDTVRPRLEAAGADIGRIHVLSAVRCGDRLRPFNLAEDIDRLEEAIETIPDPRLIVLDPISAYLGPVDDHGNAEIRSILAPLAALAAKRKIAVLAITHLRKSAGKAIYRTMGSLAFTAAARAVWGVTKDKEVEARRIWFPIKMNLGPQPAAMAYLIESGPRLVWESSSFRADADELLSTFPPKASAVAEAADWLRSALSGSSRPVRELEEEAKRAGISRAGLKRARRSLGLRAQKDPLGNWFLIQPSQKGPTSNTNQDRGLFDQMPSTP